MFLNKSGLMLAVAAALSLGSLTANADQFASFGQSVAGSPFQLTHVGTATNPFSVSGTVGVTFNYNVANGYQGILAPIAAHMAFTGTGVGPAVKAGSTLIEEFDLVSFKITADNPGANPGNILLQMANNGSGTLTGTIGGHTAGLTGDTDAGDNVVFSSDFLFFVGGSEESYGLTFNLQTDPKQSVQMTGISGVNALFADFNAGASGIFGSTPAPYYTPDGTGISLLSGGLLPFAGFALYRRRRAKK